MSGTWGTVPTSCRDAADPGWADVPRSCRDGELYVEAGYWEEGYAEAVFATWAAEPTSCRDLGLGGTGYGGGTLAYFDSLAGTGTTTTAAGWTLPLVGSCRDG